MDYVTAFYLLEAATTEDWIYLISSSLDNLVTAKAAALFLPAISR